MAKDKNKGRETQTADEDTTGGASATEDTTATEPKVTKSIVPSKYAGRYKNGGDDALATFIKAQCKDDKGEFQFPQFFALCRKNGLAEEKVAHYEGQVAEKRNGSQGRARMTLRNMLATIARKNGKLIGLDGAETDISLPKPALSGAAKAKAEEQAAAAA